jgi:hypothetical protein
MHLEANSSVRSLCVSSELVRLSVTIAMKQLHLIANIDSKDWMSYVKELMSSSRVSWKVALTGDNSIIDTFQGSTPEVLSSHESRM